MRGRLRCRLLRSGLRLGRLGDRRPVLDGSALILLDTLQFLALGGLTLLHLLARLGHVGIALDRLLAMLAGGVAGLALLKVAQAGVFGGCQIGRASCRERVYSSV